MIYTIKSKPDSYAIHISIKFLLKYVQKQLEITLDLIYLIKTKNLELENFN